MITNKKEREGFAKHASPSSIKAHIKIAEKKQARIRSWLHWLDDLLEERFAQVERGEWPPKE